MKSAGRENLVFKLVTAVMVMVSSFAFGAEPNQIGDVNLLQPQALRSAGIFALRQIDANLSGFGTNVAVVSRSFSYSNNQPLNDYRPAAAHKSFDSTKFTFYDSNRFNAGLCSHSTAMCSILFGSDANAFNPLLGSFRYSGAIPKARADIYELSYFLNNVILPQAPADEDIIVVGAGSPAEDWWTRGMESLAEKFGIVIVAPIGNGFEAFDPPLFPAAGANVIGVGVVDSVNTIDLAKSLANFSLPYPQHSSFGPTGNLSCKPDIVAPGNCLTASIEDSNRYEPSGSWTCFATPVVAGAASLLIQTAKQEPNLALALSPVGGNCLIKACLMNSAKKLPFWHKGKPGKDDDHVAPLDFLQGAGLLDAVAAYRQFTAGQQNSGLVKQTGWDIIQLNSGNTIQSYYLFVEDTDSKTISATVTWNRHYTDKYPFEPLPQKDADIRLELWASEPNNPNLFTLIDYSDSPADNVEHIYFHTQAGYKLYKLIVTYGGTQTQAVPQEYAIAWNVSEKQNDDNIGWYDLNADGIVDNTDTTTLINNIMTSLISPGSFFYGDINSNGIIDANDFEILGKNMNRKADWRNE